MRSEFYEQALDFIAHELPICYDLAWEVGQHFDNVKHMSWFIDAVADYLAELED